jgi:hypothetical protein
LKRSIQPFSTMVANLGLWLRETEMLLEPSGGTG